MEKSLAVLGGGQLGRMLGLAAGALGVPTRFLDPKPDASAQDVGTLIVAEFDDEAALERLICGARALTYEWEGVPAPTARAAEDRVAVRPPPVALDVAQDRVAEKRLFEQLDIAVAPFRPIDSVGDLDAALDTLGLPAVLKTRRGGYDGKGQAVVRTAVEARTAATALGGQDLVLEHLVEFERELSVIACRSVDGDVRIWPLTENIHEDGVLRLSRAPAGSGRLEEAAAMARKVAETLDYVGTLAIELFETGTGLLANELAPRVHNSGHWTIDGAATSQFENHVRAVLGWPLGPTEPTGHAVMVNCLGAIPAPGDVLDVPGAHLHDYRKRPNPGRKVGHITIVADDAETAARRTDEILGLIRAAEGRTEHA